MVEDIEPEIVDPRPTLKIAVVKDPRTKDSWCYLAGPEAIRKMIVFSLLTPDAKKQPFYALHPDAILKLRDLKMLDEMMAAGDIVMLRMEKTDG